MESVWQLVAMFFRYAPGVVGSVALALAIGLFYAATRAQGQKRLGRALAGTMLAMIGAVALWVFVRVMSR